MMVNSGYAMKTVGQQARECRAATYKIIKMTNDQLENDLIRGKVKTKAPTAKTKRDTVKLSRE